MLIEGVLEQKSGSRVKGAPLVSVVVPAYNVAEFIGETLDSVRAQTFADYETIVVNDGSPDAEKLEKALENHFDNIVYIRQVNGGTASARNTAIRAARGKFLAFLDGDDVWLPEYLAEQLKAIEAKDCDLIYADALLFGSVRDARENFMRNSPSRGAVTTESLIAGNCSVITSGTIAKREKILECGLFDEGLPRIGMEDFDLWFRLAKSGARLDYQRKVLLKYRVRPNSLSGSNVQRAERGLVVLDVIERKHRLNECEARAMEKRRRWSQAELELERGKLCLALENYGDARAHFERANEYYQKTKLDAVIWLLKFNPRLVLKLFKSLRRTDYSFVLPVEDPAEKAIAERAENFGN